MLGNVMVFGGTGMLSAATQWIIQRARHTTVTGRNEHRLRQLKEGDPGERASFHQLDYRDTAALKSLLSSTVSRHGSVDLVLSWIHSTAPEALPTIASEVSEASPQWRLIHIKGSANDDAAIRARPETPSNCQYREVLLGYRRTDRGSRWLTDEEISAGVVTAIQQNADTTIGQLDPWSERP